MTFGGAGPRAAFRNVVPMKGSWGGWGEWGGAGRVLLAAAAGTAVLSVLVGWWWALPAALCAFLAGVRPGSGRHAAFALAALLAADMVVVFAAPALLTPGTRVVAVALGAGVLSWCAGRFWRQYRELNRAGWERAERLERERRLVTEQARLRERSRIARDMHDVLGHDLSLIALSAGALKLAPGLGEEQRAIADTIRSRAATAVERLGEVIGILRDEAAGTPGAPAPDDDTGDDHSPATSTSTGTGTGTDLARLVSEAAASGLTVETDLTVGTKPNESGDARGNGDTGSDGDTGDEVPDAVRRATYRVVQEALTNVAKHAPGATVSVRVSRADAETRVEVSNGPPGSAGSPSAPCGVGPAPAPAPVPVPVPVPVPAQAQAQVTASDTAPVTAEAPYGGRGLVGLDERVRLAGGTFGCGSGADGGFAVYARLPHAPGRPGGRARPDVRGQPDSWGQPDPWRRGGPMWFGGEAHREYRGNRRRLGRTVLTALTVSLLAAALLGGVLTWWDRLVAKRSVLASEDFVRFGPGQERAEVAPYLPGEQTTRLPPHLPPTESGTTCEHYAISADPFDDSSGDAYRLCFRADRLVSAEVVRE